MQKIKMLLLTLVFVSFAWLAKSQTGTCNSPVILNNSVNACSLIDSFGITNGLYERFIRFNTSNPISILSGSANQIKIYIKNLSANPIYSVTLYNDSCINLTQNQISFSSTQNGDTIFLIPNTSLVNGNNYLLKIECADVTIPLSFYQVCLKVTNPCQPPSVVYGNIGSCLLAYQKPCDHVCNGGFEGLFPPPNGFGESYNFYNWGYGNDCGTSDCYSPTSPNQNVQTPCNAVGEQTAHGGICYAGLVMNNFWSYYFGYYEYLQTQLFPALLPNKLYEVSLWVSRADNTTSGVNDLAVYFSPTMMNAPLWSPISTIPAFVTTNTTVLNDEINWQEIKFCYVPTVLENFLAIGSLQHFKPPNYLPVPAGAITCTFAAYFQMEYLYVDDVSVKEFSASITATSNSVCPKTNINFGITGCLNSCITYYWNFGDGGVGFGPIPTYSYSTSGIYTVNVVAVSGTYSINLAPITITVMPAPSATIIPSTNNLCNAGVTTFTANVSPLGGPFTYTWSVTDAGTNLPVGVNITGQGTPVLGVNLVTVIAPVKVTVVITNSLGCQSAFTYTVKVCCNFGTSIIYPPNYTFTTTTLLTGTNFVFLGPVNINPGVVVTLFQTEVFMVDKTSKFNVNNNSTLLSTQCYWHGCTTQWDGIYALGGATIRLDQNIIEDAQRVIVDTLGASEIELLLNVFNKNFKGLVLKNNPSPPILDIETNAFTSSNLLASVISYSIPVIIPQVIINSPSTYFSLPKANLLPPYSTRSSLVGIECINTKKTSPLLYIRLGKDGNGIGGVVNSTQNLFDKLFFGVAMYNSRVHVLNAYFQNHAGSGRSGFPSSGIYIEGSNAVVNNFSNARVGGILSEKCYFDNNRNGITNFLSSPVNITQNNFSNNQVCIFATANAKNRLFTVFTNSLTNNILGVFMQNNVWINGVIVNNTFTNTVSTGSFSNNYAVFLSETGTPSPPNYANYFVYGNTVSGHFNGVFVSNTFSTTVQSNSITMRADNTTGNFQQGIHVVLCNAPNIFSNVIKITGSTNLGNNWQHGILTDGLNTLPSVLCNTVTDVPVNIKIQGLNYTSVSGNGYCGNIMNNYGYGFWMDANAEIGHQFAGNLAFPGTKFASDNQWFPIGLGPLRTVVSGNSNQTTAPGTFTQTFIYLRTAPISYTIPPGSYVVPTLPSFPLSGKIAPTTFNICGGGPPPFRLIQFANNIAQNNLTFGANNANLQMLSQRGLFQNLILQNINTIIDPTLNAFNINALSNNVGKFFKVDSLFNVAVAGNINTVSMSNGMTVNNAIVPVNNIDNNQKIINGIYSSYVMNGNNLDSSQIITLEPIAYLCPMTDGPAVYQARAILFGYTGKKYTNSCEFTDVITQQGGRMFNNQPAETASIEEENLKNDEIKLYPNPSANEIFVENGNCVSCQIIIFNVLGEEIIKQNLNTKTKIDVSRLSNGTYLYQIKNDEGMIIKKDKLIISR